MNRTSWCLAAAAVSFGLVIGCGASDATPTPGTPGGGGSPASSGGSNGSSGSANPGGGAGGAGALPTGGVSGSSTGNGGGGGVPAAAGGQSGSSGAATTGGSPAGGGSAGSGTGGNDPSAAGDTPPLRPLNVTASKDQHKHVFSPKLADPLATDATGQTGGNTEGIVDPRAPKLMGKLLISLGVGGSGAWSWASKRGYHSMGVDFYQCDLNYDTREHNGNCRLETFDGIDRTPQMVVDYHDSILGHITEGIKYLQGLYPEEDWGYFLTADGKLRLSDVAVTGFSHGAQSAARFARAYRMFRAVSRSGPRDNGCGNGNAGGMDYDPQNPPFDPNCPDEDISAWLDEESKTPVERLFGFTGKNDGQYGDIMFSMERMGYVGQPVNISLPANNAGPFTTNRFYGDVGHSGFDDGSFDKALEYAFGIPPENSNPQF